MKNRLPLIVAGIVAVALIGFVFYRVAQPKPAAPQSAAATATPATSTEDPDEAARRAVQRIEPEQLLNEMKSGNVTIIDVRDADAFAQQHIPGSRHVPLAQVETTAPYLPKSKPIVAYCT